jgi:cytochrome c oxidase subunit 1
VAHFHYVLFGGAIFGLFSGFYYWWPKMFGRLLNEAWGKANFWLMVIGMNLTFGPMHIIGLQGQPRRMYVYDEANVHARLWNAVSTIGMFILALGILAFIINVWVTHRSKNPAVKAPLDPWDARSLEWMTTNPPVAHNFDAIPTVHELDEFFHRKYAVDHDTDEIKQVATAEEILAEQQAHAEKDIHLPSPSYWPLILSLSLPIIAFGVIYNHILIAVGAALSIAAIFGWSMEPSVAAQDDYEPPTPTDGEVKELTA